MEFWVTFTISRSKVKRFAPPETRNVGPRDVAMKSATETDTSKTVSVF
jgi:hypothetical protein